MMRRLLTVTLPVVLVIVNGPAALAAWTSTGGNTGSVTATSVKQASQPSAETGPNGVTLSWLRSTLASGDSVGRYVVLRDGTEVCSSAETSSATTSCVDPAPMGQTVTYTVVAEIGAWTGPASPGTQFTYDNTAPGAPSAPDLIAADDTGSSDEDNITSQSNVTVEGSAEAGSTVKIYRGTTLLGTGVATGGRYSIGNIALVEGQNDLHATATDAAGNNSSSSTLTVIRSDATAAMVMGVSSTAMDRSYGVGAVIPVTVTFSEPVTVTGTPQLALATGSPVSTQVNYTSGTGTQTLAFTYSVAANNASPDLDYVNTGSLTLNGGTIRDVAGNNANLTLAAPGSAGSLGASKAIVIDGVAPTVSNVQLFNKTEGTPGKVEHGDQVVVTLSERLDANSVCGSWTNSGVTNSWAANNDVVVTVNNAGPSGSSDTLTVSSGSCVLNFGTVDLKADYVTGEVTFKGPATQNQNSVFTLHPSGVITITLGTPASNQLSRIRTGVSAAAPVYTPSGVWKDVAGNAMPATAKTGTSSGF